MKNTFNRMIKFLKNEIHIPPELKESREFKILHLSDTPSQIFGSLISLVKELNPDIIIHTGDLADDIKLEIHPGLGRLYARTIGPFLTALIQNIPDTIVIPGNHDDVSILKRIVPRVKILSPGTIEIQNHIFGVAHNIEELPNKGQFMLYGHNFELPENPGNSIYLNGVISINIILFPSEKIFRINYPGGTDYLRKYRKLRRLL